EQSRRQTDLADVMHEPALVRKLLLLLGKPEPPCNITRIDGHGSRMSCRVPISSIEGGNQSSGEGGVGPLQTIVCGRKVTGELTLILIEPKEALRRQGGEQEQREGERRHLQIRHREKSHERGIQEK